jgi:hypothetical protein
MPIGGRIASALLVIRPESRPGLAMQRKGPITSDSVTSENSHKCPKIEERFVYRSVLLF